MMVSFVGTDAEQGIGKEHAIRLVGGVHEIVEPSPSPLEFGPLAF